MRKIILLTFLLITSYTFSQNPYQVNKIFKDGDNGSYSFKVIGEITFGKKVFDTDKTKDMPKMYFPVFFKNFKIISITTPNGKTYSNDDLVYKTDSQYYPNGIKLPIILSNDQAQNHFKIYGEVNFNGIYTTFVKSVTNTSYAKDNEFWIDNGGFKYDITQKIITRLENENRLKGLSRLERNEIINTELERLFFSNNQPRISKIILEPYGKGNKDLNNLMQLASEAETRIETSSNDDSESKVPTSNTNNSSAQQTENSNNYNSNNQYSNTNSQSNEEIIGDAVLDFTQQIINSGIFKSDPEAKAKRLARRERLREKQIEEKKILKDGITQFYELIDPYLANVYESNKKTKFDLDPMKFPNGVPYKLKGNSKLKKVGQINAYGYKLKNNWVIEPKYFVAYQFNNNKAVVALEENNIITINILNNKGEDITYLSMSKNMGEFYSNNENIEMLIKYIDEQAIQNKPDNNLESKINFIGYYILKIKKNSKDALKVFIKNVQLFPDSFYVYDSLGECLLELGLKNEAIQAYENSLEINPTNQNAINALKNI